MLECLEPPHKDFQNLRILQTLLVMRFTMRSGMSSARQKTLGKDVFVESFFAECYTRRTIRRVFSVFCRVFGALGKLKESGSDVF